MKYYTGVGSRQIPVEAYDLLHSAAATLCRQGWILRSGHAEGSDTAFELGCDSVYMGSKEIFIPWEGFGWTSGQGMQIPLSSLANAKEAEYIASKIHPAWNKCSRGAKALHTRNVYQVLGVDLATPSKFLLCYARSGWDHVPEGGTRTAWVLAKEYGIECFNIELVKDAIRVREFLEGK
jgi:hypothetical protein